MNREMNMNIAMPRLHAVRIARAATCAMLCVLTMVGLGHPMARAQAPKRTVRAPAPVTTKPRPLLNASAIDEARNALDGNLRDYRAARFKEVRLVKTAKGFNAFCGQINSTNGMGGYIGWRAFMLPLGNDGVAGLYDKPTIEGQPTKIAAFMKKYAGETAQGDPATNMIAASCGTTAQSIDEADYSEALTHKS